MAIDESAETDGPAESPKDSAGTVQVLGKSVRVLDCFSPERARLTIAEIRRLTGLPPTTAARLVKSLVDLDLLQRHGDEYGVGLRVLGWTASATAASDLMEAVGPVLVQLRDLTGETSGVYLRRGNTRIVVAVELSTQSIVYRPQLGQVLPMHAGAAGKVFMAFDRRALAETLALERSATDPLLSDRGALETLLASVRERGWAFTQQEREAGLNSLSVPVFDGSRQLVAALAVGGPSFRLTSEVSERVGPQMAEAGLELSRRLGWTPPAG